MAEVSDVLYARLLSILQRIDAAISEIRTEMERHQETDNDASHG
jgi:hypothetical protein